MADPESASNDSDLSVAQAGTDREYTRRKRRVLLMLLGYSGLLGVISVFRPEENPLRDFVLGLPILLMAVKWCSLDARQHNFVLTKLIQVCLVLIFILAFPLYIFQSRGVGGVKTLVQTGLFAAAMVACQIATWYVTTLLQTLIGVQ
jgi:hypothetical protein